MPNVSAIVLTYNRVELLQQCLEGIESQDRAVDFIIVIDNGSTDDTAEFLKKYSSEKLFIATIPQNCGAAGGFHHALKAGQQSGASFLWLMDDDVVPAPAALGELLAAQAALDAQGIDAPYLLSVAHSPDGSMTNVPDLDKRTSVRGYPQWPALLEQGLVPIRRGTFVSALFPRRTLETFGLPLAEMYMWGEDTEYTMRVTRQHAGWLVGRSHVDHLRAQPGSLDITTETDPRRIALHRVHVRNLIYTSRLFMGRRRKAHAVLRTVKQCLRLLRRGHLRHASVIATGLVDGLIFRPAGTRDEAPVAFTRPAGFGSPAAFHPAAGKGELECAY